MGASYFEVVPEGVSCKTCLSHFGRKVAIDNGIIEKTLPPFHYNCDCGVKFFDQNNNILVEIEGFTTAAENELGNQKNKILSMTDILYYVFGATDADKLTNILTRLTSYLTQEQINDLLKGRPWFSIMSELSPENAKAVQALTDSLERGLSQDKQAAVSFLSSSMFGSTPMEIRIKIYEHLKAGNGVITNLDLAKIYAGAAGNISFGNNKNAAYIIEQEYRHAKNGTSFLDMDLLDQQQRNADAAGVLGMLGAVVAGNVLIGNGKLAFSQSTAQKSAAKATAGNKTAEGFQITDGKVAGKIPIDDFYKIRKESVKNPGAKTMTLGKYINASDSYIKKAVANSTYFDMGNDWDSIQQKYNLSEQEMFKYFNVPALDDAMNTGKTLRFSHHPLLSKGALAREWEYIKNVTGFTDKNLIKIGEFWYAK